MNASPDQKTKYHPLDVYGDTKRTMWIFQWFMALIMVSLIAGIHILLHTAETFRNKACWSLMNVEQNSKFFQSACVPK